MSSRRISFRCPKCGSSKFGSFMRSPEEDSPAPIVPGSCAPPLMAATLTRSCHGEVLLEQLDAYAQCAFTWPESDDYKHFVQSFATKEQFDKAYRAETEVEGLAVQVKL
jgi:hypothetical protein